MPAYVPIAIRGAGETKQENAIHKAGSSVKGREDGANHAIE
ncbi:hypothetical protein V3595_09390 [Bacillus sp. CFBP9009]